MHRESTLSPFNTITFQLYTFISASVCKLAQEIPQTNAMVVDMIYHLVAVKELEEEQFPWVEVVLVELVVGMSLQLPVDAVEVVLEFKSNL